MAGRRDPFRNVSQVWLILLWFAGLFGGIALTIPTLITTADLFRVLGLLVALAAVLLRFLSRRWGFDPWTSMIVGFFGLVPALYLLFVTANTLVGPVEELDIPIVSIERPAREDRLYMHLEGERFAKHPVRVLSVRRDVPIWYARTLHLKVRHGILGPDVLLERTFEADRANGPLPAYSGGAPYAGD